MQVAIQGIKGCFHEIAAFKFFGEREELDMVECMSFPQFFQRFENKADFYGVMAIENTVAGTILPNYAMLRNSDLTVIGEAYLRIQHHLLVTNGQAIEEIKEVRSHPMAILQCHKYFEQYPHIKLIEAEDTALSAKVISDQQSKGVGAIASSLAADHYHLNILASGIETNKRNFTRFLVLQHKDVAKEVRKPNKASLCFHAAHEVGSLAKILSIFSEHQINLSKIQSLPVVGKVWEYFFHIDVEMDDYAAYQQALQEILPYITELKILGEYKVGIKHRTI